MSKKTKKGSKKGGTKNAEQEEKEQLTEVDKELFQIQITDLMRKVERLKNRCRELETSNEEYQKRYNQLDEDRADIIAYLKRVLQQETDEITELEERLVGLQKSKDADAIMYLERFSQFEKDYKLMHEQLTSEIKLLSGKVNSLEEFRIQREDLTKKYKNQEERIEQQEILHQQAMYDLEKKFIIGKDKLKKEMEAKLLQLSTDFREATQLQIAATTHRAIRENIALSNEYNQMLEESRELINENMKLKKLNHELRLEAKLHEEEKKTVIANSKVQLKLLETMTEDHEQMAGQVTELREQLQHCTGVEEELTELRGTTKARDTAIEQLSTTLQATRMQEHEAFSQLAISSLHVQKLQHVIQRSISTIKNALLIHTDLSYDKAAIVAGRENVLGTLLNLLDSASELPLSTAQLSPSSDQMGEYMTGDLSLVSPAKPPHESQQQHTPDQLQILPDTPVPQPDLTPARRPKVVYLDELGDISDVSENGFESEESE